MDKFQDVFLHTWSLGLLSFGGPVVHFQIFHKRFVARSDPWISEQTFQELFAICQALPGPASTKMIYSIALLKGGLLAALSTLLTWSLPGAIGMYGLALGVARLSDKLPNPVFALLTGLNAATVGIIALAAVELASKSITDPLTRVLVILAACAGLCYNALWYFPVLVLIGGFTTLFWDMLGRRWVARLQRRRNPSPETPTIVPADPGVSASNLVNRINREETPESVRTVPPSIEVISKTLSVKQGIAVIIAFLVSLTVILVVNATLPSPPLLLKVFRNMYLAGTIIFGGGPVVIPLLREYVVSPGFVTTRDFLIGLAIIQAFPGPNFNFAVYLGTLAISKTSTPSIVGAILGFLGIFAPGIILATAFQALWRVVRSYPAVSALLRGVNAAAVGLVFTAVYRLWEIGYLTPRSDTGISLGLEPWWVCIATLAYSSSAWFGVSTWMSILAGAVLGLCWFAVTKPW